MQRTGAAPATVGWDSRFGGRTRLVRVVHGIIDTNGAVSGGHLECCAPDRKHKGDLR